ncbi:MAG: hypothetical protein ACLGHC_04600 [Alphaproteobacteria bacterium]
MFEPLIDSVPDIIEIDGDTATISLAADGQRTVAVEVRLWPISWNGVRAHDLTFLIVVADGQSEPQQIFDRDDAAPFIASVRGLVMPCVLKAAAALVTRVGPNVIYGVTQSPHPPRNAVRRHEKVTALVEQLGYEIVQVGLDPHERIYWLAVRAGEEDEDE